MLYHLDFLILALDWFALFCLKNVTWTLHPNGNKNNYNNETKGETFPFSCFLWEQYPSQLLFNFVPIFQSTVCIVCLTPFLPITHSLKYCHLTSILTTNYFCMTFQLPNLVHLNSHSLVTFCIIGSCFPLKALFSFSLKACPPCLPAGLCFLELFRLVW